MSIWKSVTNLFQPIADLADNLHTSDEERLTIKAKVFELQTQTASQMMHYETEMMKAKTQIITAEAQGNSWLQRNWRPITMLTFLGLVVLDTFGLTAIPLSGEAWTLLQIGLGGYVVGRSVEKIAPQFKDK